MQKCVVRLLLLSCIMAFVAGCATTNSAGDYDYSNYKIASHPSDLHKGAKVKVLRSMGDSVVVGIYNVEVLYIEIYGRGIEKANATINEEGWVEFTLHKGRWFNFVFRDRTDNMWHFVYVTKEDADMPPDWMDESVTTFQPSGWGAAMTAREFRKK